MCSLENRPEWHLRHAANSSMAHSAAPTTEHTIGPIASVVTHRDSMGVTTHTACVTELPIPLPAALRNEGCVLDQHAMAGLKAPALTQMWATHLPIAAPDFESETMHDRAKKVMLVPSRLEAEVAVALVLVRWPSLARLRGVTELFFGPKQWLTNEPPKK